MSPTKSRGKFQSAVPISSRPEERIAAQTAQRRVDLAAQRRRRISRPSPMTVAILFFAIVGFGIASYTTAVHYGGFNPACFGGSAHSSCEQVQSSIYNNVGGIPVAVLGLIGYFVILSSLPFDNEYGRAAGFLTALIGFFFSMYLTFREAVSLHGTYCEWCLGSATCMTFLMILLGVRFIRAAPTVRTASSGD